MSSTPGIRPCSPSSSSVTSTSTPTVVLVEKLEWLDQKWSAHKKQSPIKIMNSGKRYSIKQHSEQSSRNLVDIKSSSSRTRRRNQPRHVDDDGSLGHSAISVSTLGSTESVFERLYRQRTSTPKFRHCNQDSSYSDNSGEYRRDKFSTPSVIARRSRSTKSRRDRLGAYSNISPNDAENLVFAGTTPRRRSKQNSSLSSRHSNSYRHDDYSSVTSTTSRGSDVDVDRNSVFNRLYRNEKRTEKLWKKPRKWTPTLSSSGITKIERNAAKKTGGESGKKNLFPKGKKESPQETHDDRQDHLCTSFHEIVDKLPDKKPPRNNGVSNTQKSIEPIGAIVKHVENAFDGCSPTVAATSVSSMNWDESPDKHSKGTQHRSIAGIPKAVLDEEKDELNAIGEQMEVDHPNYSGLKCNASQNSTDQNKNDSYRNEAQLIIRKENPKDTLNVSCNDFESNNEEYNENKEWTIRPQSNHDADSSTTNILDDNDSLSLNQSFKGLPIDQTFFVDRIDRISRKTRRRNCKALDNMNNDFTLNRVLNGSAMTIQKAFRLHLAELRLTSAIIQSWKVTSNFHETETRIISCTLRQRAFEQAVRAVKCWWILEGLQIDDNWITLAWENEVCIGDCLRVQVNLTCEAKSIKLISREWEPTKVAILLTKVGLFNAIQREQASQRISKFQYEIDDKSHFQLHESALILQHWFRKYQSKIGIQKEDAKKLGKNTSSFSTDKRDDYGKGIPCSDDKFDLSISSLKVIQAEVVDDAQYVYPNAPLENTCLPDEHVAAIKIQSFMRLAILRSALREWPSTNNQIRTIFETTGVSLEHKTQIGSIGVARKILRNSMVDHQVTRDGYQVVGEAQTKRTSEKDYISQRATTLAIHNIVRTYVTALKKCRENKKAAIVQTIFRGYKTRKRLELEHFSAFIIQCVWSKRRYIRIKVKNATKIQTLWRRFECQRDYDICRFCVIFIQSGWRRAIVRKRLRFERASAILVQTVWRGSKDRIRYLKFLSAIRSIQDRFKRKHAIAIYRSDCHVVTLLQSWWRMQHSRMVFLQSLKASILIQANVRCYIPSRNFHKVQFDSVMIQRTWRAYRWTTHYTRQKRATIRLQSFCRAIVSFKIADRRRRRILDIQRVFRGFISRRNLSELIFSVSKLQKVWRRHKCQVRYRQSIRAIIKIQNFSRRSIHRIKYQVYCEAILTIQRITRGCMCRHQMHFYKEARRTLVETKLNGATSIQKLWRGIIERKRYIVVIRSIIILQKIARRVLAQSSYKEKLSCVRMIQSWFKRVVDKSRVNKARIASTEIQRFWRSKIAYIYVAMLKLKRINASATMIQSLWRGVRARTSFHKLQIATIALQSFYRSGSARRVLQVLIHQKIIQESTSLIQSRWRGAVAREKYILARIAAIMIQASARRMLASKYTKELIHRIIFKRAVILIQSYWRRAVAYNDYKKVRITVIRFQSFIRRRLGAKLTERLRNEKYSRSSLMIQTNWRGAMARELFTTTRGSAIIIQASSRRMMACRTKAALEYEKQASISSILIQSQWRAAKARSYLLKCRSSAIVIQTTFRRISRLKEVQSLKTSIRCSVLIQSHWRGGLQRDRYSEGRVAVTSIQSCVRGMLSRIRYNHMGNSSVLIQRAYRGYSARNTFLMYRRAAVHIQRRFRLFRLKCHQSDTVLSAILIQKLWRRTLTRSKFNSYLKSTIIIQRVIREILLRRQLHRRDIFAIKIQKKWRLWRRLRHQKALTLSILLQSHWRSLIARDEYLQYRAATMLIQAMIRGSYVRSQLKILQSSAVRIQYVIRRYHRRKLIKAELRLKKAAHLIQIHWRRSLAQFEFMRRRAAAMIIQATLRGYCGRSQFKILQASAVRIQCASRRYFGRKNMIEAKIRLENATILVQSYWRESLARYKYMQYRVAAMVIQAMIRGAHVRSQWRFVRYLSEKKTIMNGSARRIQAAYMFWRIDISVWEMRSSAILLRRSIRGQLARSAVKYALQHVNSSRNSAISYSRSLLILDQGHDESLYTLNVALFEARTSAVIVVQSFVRRFLARKLIKEIYGLVFDKRLAVDATMIRIQNAAIVIQRSFLAWSQLRNHYAFKIQKFIRTWIAWKKFRFTLSSIREDQAATKIQKYQRCREQKWKFIVQKYATIMIQASWRKRLANVAYADLKAKHKLAAMTNAAIKIQAFQRCQKQRLNYSLKKVNVIRIQTLWRALLTRKTLMTYTIAATIIQVKCRHYLFQKKYNKEMVSRVGPIKRQLRREIVERRAARRLRKFHRQEIHASNQVISEIRRYSTLLVDSLLTKQEFITIHLRVQSTLKEAQLLTNQEPIAIEIRLKKLAARVHSTLNEADSLSNQYIRDCVAGNPRIIPFPSNFQKLDTDTPLQSIPDDVRISCTDSDLNDSDLSSNIDIRDFINLRPLNIPLPLKAQKSNKDTLMCKASRVKGVPDKTNKTFQISLKSYANNLVAEVDASTLNSGQKQLKSTNNTISPAVVNNGDLFHRKHSENHLAHEAIEMKQEVRAAIQRNLHETPSGRPNSASTISMQNVVDIPTFEGCETSGENEHVRIDKSSLKNFGNETMPSPIRPLEEKVDWDWTYEW